MHSRKQASAENDAAKPRRDFARVRQVVLIPRTLRGGKRGMTCGEFQGIAARNAIELAFWDARSTATGGPIRKPFLELSRARALLGPGLPEGPQSIEHEGMIF